MTQAEGAATEAVLSLLAAHPPLPCEQGCKLPDGSPVLVESRLARNAREKLDQSGPPLDVAIYEHICGWVRTVPLKLVLQDGGAEVVAAVKF